VGEEAEGRLGVSALQTCNVFLLTKSVADYLLE
jgi:hypothetical protein